MVLQKLGVRRLWGPVSTLAVLQPYAIPRNNFPGNLLKDICIFLYHYNPLTHLLTVSSIIDTLELQIVWSINIVIKYNWFLFQFPEISEPCHYKVICIFHRIVSCLQATDEFNSSVNHLWVDLWRKGISYNICHYFISNQAKNDLAWIFPHIVVLILISNFGGL